MLWEGNKELAVGLRNQGLADCLAARFALRRIDIKLLGQPMTFAHLVVSKCQQSVEKLTKGLLLWGSANFHPGRGHSPFTELVDSPHQKRFLQALAKTNKSLVGELRWLESLAPKMPTVAEGQRGGRQPLNIIPENTEYPFWSVSKRSLVIPALGITLEGHGVPAFKALRKYLSVLSKSDPPDYCREIGDFLIEHPMSTEITAWPPRSE